MNTCFFLLHMVWKRIKCCHGVHDIKSSLRQSTQWLDVWALEWVRPSSSSRFRVTPSESESYLSTCSHYLLIFSNLGKLVSLSVPQVSYLKNEPNSSFLVGLIGRLNVIMYVKSQAQRLGYASKNDSFHVNFSLLDPHYLAQGSINMI